MPRSSNITVQMRLRGARKFQADVRGAAAELEMMGVRGVNSLAAFSRKADKLKDFGSRMARNVTLPIAGVGAIAGKVAIDFDTSMRNVNSIAQLGEKQFKSLSEEVVNLAGPTAQSPKTLADGLYDLVSSGFDADDSMLILNSSARAATAGLTDAATSTKAVAAVLNAYKLPAKDAAAVSDTLFRTVDRGVISFEDLASNIGDALPFASSLGIELAEVGAATATMTKQGISPAETMTRIKSTMQSLIKPSTQLKDTFKELGYESGEAMIKELGFQGTLEELAKSTGNSKAELAELFPNVRALGGVLALTGDNAKGAGQDLKGMMASEGSTTKALSEQRKSLSYQWNRLKAQLSALAVEVMPAVLDALRGVVDQVSKLVNWFGNLSPQTQKMIVVGLGLLAVLGPMVYLLGAVATATGYAILGAGKLVTAYKWLRSGIILTRIEQAKWIAGMVLAKVRMMAVAVATKAWTVAQKLLNLAMRMNPLGMIITAIGLLVAAVVTAWHKHEKFREVVKRVWDWIKTAATNVADWVVEAFKDIVAFFKDLPDKLKSALSTVWDVITAPFKKAFEWIVDKIEWALDKIEEIHGKLEDLNPLDRSVTPDGSLSDPNGLLPSPGRGQGGTRPRRTRNPDALPRMNYGDGRGGDTVVENTITLDGRAIGNNTLRLGRDAAARA